MSNPPDRGPASTADWRPLLAGELAERARAAVDDIAIALQAGVDGVDLATGRAGVAVFLAHLANERDDAALGDRAVELIDEAFTMAAGQPLGWALYGGFTGLAWAAAHLELEDLGDDVDRSLGEMLDAGPWPGSYDLVSGLVGIGVYALERLDTEAGRANLERVLDRLAELARQDADGVAWLTPAGELSAPARAETPAGRFNLGMAHGIPGIIALLAAIQDRLPAPRTRALLRGAASWVQAHLLPPSEPAGIPLWWAGDDRPPEPARTAWCWGNPGAAVALFAAARVLDDPALAARAVEMALAAATSGNTGDAGLCHGAAGIAHLCNRLAQASGDERLAEAARAWNRRVLDLRSPGTGVAGFTPLDGRGRPEQHSPRQAGFLDGAAGIGLALLAATSARDPAWDRALLTAATACRSSTRTRP